jgi:phage terminase large subunit GpA-like protein
MSSDIEFLINCNDEKPTDPPPELISEYINHRRVLPPGSPMPGPIDVYYTPYFVEIMDCMSPYSGVDCTSVMKGVQIGATANCAENPIAYFMDAFPQEILYCSATDALLEKWTKRLEPLIDSCGYRHKIAAQVENTKSRKTGDKMYSKEYPGGSLSMTSLQSPAGLRSESKRILIVDEIDGAPPKLTTGEGSALSVLSGRIAAYGSRGKKMEFSTPSTIEKSVINKQYLAGDQRRFNVPCPECGAEQVLEFKQLRPEYINDILDHVYYECEHCQYKILNHHKTKMLVKGIWRPTATARSKNHRSYHISTLYSPVGMMSWTGIYQKYLDALDDPDQMPSFVNLYLGMPYKEEGSRPDINKVISLRGNYKDGTVPNGTIYLTLAADVQRGSKIYQDMSPEELTAEIARMKSEDKNLWKSKLPRIEIEVFGIGLSYRSWSVDYKVFYGHTTHNAHVGAFEEFYQWAAEHEGMNYYRDDGVLFMPQMVFVDASDGETQSSVFDFCDRFGPNTYPVINYDWLKKKKDPGIDEETQRNFDRYRIAKKSKGGAEYIQISTNFYKKTLYSRLKIERDGLAETQAPAFCEFPSDRADYYFSMLTGEELRPNGSFYNSGRPVEALDVRVYNMCAADVWLESAVRKMQDNARKAGYSDLDIDKHDKKYFLNKLDLKINS